MMSPDQKLEAYDALMAEVGAALADIAEAMSNDQSHEAIESMAQSVAELAEKMIDHRGSFEAIANAIKGLKIQAPEVNVSVMPAPINMPQPLVTVIDKRADTDFLFVPTYDKHGSMTEIRVKRVASK
jgi:hypothetical protein